MDAKTFPEVFALMRDPNTHSFTAQIDSWFVSFIKSQVGKTVYVYGVFGTNSDILINPKTQYPLAAVVSDDKIYAFDTLDILCEYRHESAANGVVSFGKYVSELNARAKDLYKDWYNDLPANAILSEYQRQESANTARRLFIEKGPSDESMLDAPNPKSQIVDSIGALKILSGLTGLDEIFETWAQKNESQYCDIKTSRLLSLELIRKGSGVTEQERKMASALWPLTVKFVTINFEHNGITISGKVSLDSVRDAIFDHRFSAFADFSSANEEEKIRETLMGKRNDTYIPVDFVQSIVCRNKTVYVREDRN